MGLCVCVRGASASRCGTVGAAAVRYASARCSILGDWAEPMQWISARSIRRVLRATSPADSLAPGLKRCDKHVSVSRLDHCVQSFPSAPAALLKVPPPRWLSHSMARSAAAHHTAQEQERHTHHTHTHTQQTDSHTQTRLRGPWAHALACPQTCNQSKRPRGWSLASCARRTSSCQVASR